MKTQRQILAFGLTLSTLMLAHCGGGSATTTTSTDAVGNLTGTITTTASANIATPKGMVKRTIKVAAASLTDVSAYNVTDGKAITTEGTTDADGAFAIPFTAVHSLSIGDFVLVKSPSAGIIVCLQLIADADGDVSLGTGSPTTAYKCAQVIDEGACALGTACDLSGFQPNCLMVAFDKILDGCDLTSTNAESGPCQTFKMFEAGITNGIFTEDDKTAALDTLKNGTVDDAIKTSLCTQLEGAATGYTAATCESGYAAAATVTDNYAKYFKTQVAKPVTAASVNKATATDVCDDVVESTDTDLADCQSGVAETWKKMSATDLATYKDDATKAAVMNDAILGYKNDGECSDFAAVGATLGALGTLNCTGDELKKIMKGALVTAGASASVSKTFATATTTDAQKVATADVLKTQVAQKLTDGATCASVSIDTAMLAATGLCVIQQVVASGTFDAGTFSADTVLGAAGCDIKDTAVGDFPAGFTSCTGTFDECVQQSGEGEGEGSGNCANGFVTGAYVVTVSNCGESIPVGTTGTVTSPSANVCRMTIASGADLTWPNESGGFDSTTGPMAGNYVEISTTSVQFNLTAPSECSLTIGPAS